MKNKKSIIGLAVVLFALGSVASAAYYDGWEITYETGNTPTDIPGWYSFSNFSPDNTTWDATSPGIYNIISNGNAGQQRSWGGNDPFLPDYPEGDMTQYGIRIRNYADGWNTTVEGERWFTYYENPTILANNGWQRSAVGFSIQFGTEDSITLKAGMTSDGAWKSVSAIPVETSDGWYDMVIEFNDITGKGRLFINGVVVGDAAGYDVINEYVGGSCNWGNYVASSNDYGRFDVDTVWTANGPVPEPATISLLIAGGLLAIRRKK